MGQLGYFNSWPYVADDESVIVRVRHGAETYYYTAGPRGTKLVLNPSDAIYRPPVGGAGIRNRCRSWINKYKAGTGRYACRVVNREQEMKDYARRRKERRKGKL